ncbi:redox-active disulfide protein 2 [Spirosoma sp. HMF3257]|uniref:Redox-active disulfide protein 2 n=1 Tax=Spirosoma telluris TaxID=2183553 RepID=A0A327NR22_9BACT|nr:redox-active disulfide protein 2 [Spirosoma telluris]RAI75138.1 redox-active disulfide protein 2 [Spirosoma telluris]
MKSEDLKNMSTEQLLKQQKTTRFVIGLFIGALVSSLAINIYNTGFSSKLITPLALLPLVFVIRNSLKQIQQELATRPKQEPGE